MTKTGRSASNLEVRRVMVGLRRSDTRGLALLLAALWMIAFATGTPAFAEPPENSVCGSVTEVSRSAEVVLVEEKPSEQSGSAKGEFAVTEKTEILEQQDGEQAPASFEDLRVGQMVEATYAGPVGESYPTQGIAGRIVILDETRTDKPDDGSPAVLPDTGGAPLPVMAALLIAGGLLVRRVAGYSLR